ncbi:hypothetical protein FB45DRAFT_1036403 [Roridomyces roridus]|uniref:Uncharacterized protein n=1 Tax=Roridomyces roridus TaxID=1738132 RepID=A0AAD7B921_9AGAR|nr:hypothetical protein FB45DRAFT_1036403 [Roridomyces roridus]
MPAVMQPWSPPLRTSPSLSMNQPPELHETRPRSLADDTEDTGSGETLLDKPGLEPTERDLSRQRSILALCLHLALVTVQFLLLVVWHQEWEHEIIFTVDQELHVARLVKGILTTFITLYSALLVFVTQSLALRHDLNSRQPLTATHDNAVAWSGLGSAVVRLWQQRAVPASPVGVLCALIYLAGIAVLHTAFPAVAAPQSFVVNQSVPISTQNLPAFDLSGVNETNRQDFMEAAEQYAFSSLSFLPFLTPSNTLGLHEATLYDVLTPNGGTGSVRVNATGFNISCGYIPDAAVNATARRVDVGGEQYFLEDVCQVMISTLRRSPSLHEDSTFLGRHAVFYASIPVLDSNNNTAPWINGTELGPPPTVWAVQIFWCTLGLVEQTVLVDSQSHNFTSFAFKTPPIEKHTSTWNPLTQGSTNLSSAAFSDGTKGFLDIWEGWYSAMPIANPSPLIAGAAALGLTVADMALLQPLELYPFNTTPRTSVYLHEVENQLAKSVASMFWTHSSDVRAVGHVPAPSGYINSSQPFNVSLLTGQAIVSEPVIQNRLALNIISILECLVASLIISCLSFRLCLLGRRWEAPATRIDGLDVLQTIWLYRDHPELVASLEQVQVPTDFNLRRAGMVRVQLINGTGRIPEVLEEVGELSEDADGLSGTTYPADKQASTERLGSTWTCDLVLGVLSTTLHLGLLVIHLILAVLCSMGLEHRITFALSHQSLVALLISTLATASITIYTAGLVFLAQTLSIRRSLRKTQMLTVTDDTVAAWRGVGSAFASVFHQSRSLSAVISVLLYLVGILALHITSPALFAVQVFNSTVSVPVRTQGIPQFTFSGYEPSSIGARTDILHSPLLYAQGSLSYFPFVNSSSPTLGLEGGILYDVLNNPDFRTGTATVDAVQLNMTCGYFPDPVINSTWHTIKILGLDYMIPNLGDGVFSTLEYAESGDQGMVFDTTALFYSAVPIFDSAGNTGPLVNVSAMTAYDVDIRLIQIFGCSLGLINRSISVDSQSRVLSSPGAVRKNSSVWSPVQDTGNRTASADAYDRLAYDWESFYAAGMSSSNGLESISDMLWLTPASLSISSVSRFFTERFNLDSAGSSVTLHQFEDALAELVASMYWTRHIPPLPSFTPTSLEPNGPPPMEVSLLQGNADLIADTIEARLDANMTFIILGTVISGVLFLLSLQFSVFRKPTRDEGIISGMGPLHIIWLFRNHPELESELEQVVDPTTTKLRKAGMSFIHRIVVPLTAFRRVNNIQRKVLARPRQKQLYARKTLAFKVLSNRECLIYTVCQASS